MEIARLAAPEIDRLVFTIAGRVRAKHGARLVGFGHERGLETLELLPHFESFLLAGTLTRELATVRMRYWPPERVLGRLDELEQKQLVRPGEFGLVATPSMRPLLEALLSSRADVAAEAWGRHDEDVATATQAAAAIASAASDRHVVAVAHRALRVPDDPYLALEHRLLTLRYIRQHDHAAAWLDRGLAARQMVAMTSLWHGDQPEEAGDASAALVEMGYLAQDLAGLTPAGIEIREAIEVDTNARAQMSFDVLDEAAATGFLAALRRLPDVID